MCEFTDANFLQLVCAFRICFPDVGIVLSTRETEAFRNGIAPLGITSKSAGSHTEPGGYTGEGSIHFISLLEERVELEDDDTTANEKNAQLASLESPTIDSTSRCSLADRR